MSKRIDTIGNSSIQHLPVDVISDILSRLSVKTLLRFTSVCKAWCALIRSPNFVSTHLKKRSFDTLLVLFEGHEPAISLYSVNSLDDEPIDLELPFLGETTYLTVAGICNGLLVVSLSIFEFRVVIYNPSTRQISRVPPCKFWGNVGEFSLGFGYHPSTDDYKLLKILSNREGIGKVEIYSMSTNSWRDIVFQPLAYPTDLRSLWASATINGVIYWEGRDELLAAVVLSFDMNDEFFRVIEYPPSNESGDWKLTQLQGKLAAVLCTGRRSFEVYVMDGNESCWSLKYKVGPFSAIELPVCTDEGCRFSMLRCGGNGQLILEDRVVGEVKSYIYDLNTKEIKSLPDLGQRRRRHYCHVYWYTESLVPVQKNNEV